MGGRAGLDLGRGRGRTSQRMQKIVCLAEAAPEKTAREGGGGVWIIEWLGALRRSPGSWQAGHGVARGLGGRV